MDCAKTASRVAAHLCVALALIGLLVLAGCGGDSSEGRPRFDTSGKVTWGGEPVSGGVVIFTPDASQGNNGPPVQIPIVDGQYDTAVRDRGHMGGPHTVRIQGREGSPPDTTPLFEFYEGVGSIDLGKETSTHDFEVPGDWK